MRSVQCLMVAEYVFNNKTLNIINFEQGKIHNAYAIGLISPNTEIVARPKKLGNVPPTLTASSFWGADVSLGEHQEQYHQEGCASLEGG